MLLLAKCGHVAVDGAEVAGTFEGAPRSGDLVLQFDDAMSRSAWLLSKLTRKSERNRSTSARWVSRPTEPVSTNRGSHSRRLDAIANVEGVAARRDRFA